MRHAGPAIRAAILMTTAAIVSACVTIVSSPAPTTSPAPPTAAVTPMPLPPASPSPSETAIVIPGASPTAVGSPDSPVIDAFLERFAAAKPPFHNETIVSGSYTAGVETGEISVTVDGDVSGEDFAGTYHAEGGGQTQDAEIVIVDGVAYVRSAGADWQVVPEFHPTQPFNPFELLEPADLVDLGHVTRAGQELHQLRTTRWIGDEIVIPAVPDATLESSVFDIFVTDDGIPVEAQLVFAIVGTSAERESVRFVYDVLYRFSDVGVPVTIEAPELEP